MLIIPDAKYHGERSYESDFTSPVTFDASQDTEKMYKLFSSTVKDIRIIMDYMESKSISIPIDFDVIGYSLGGIITIMLNAVDDRLTHAIACVPPMNLKNGAMAMGMTEENAEKLSFMSTKNFASRQNSLLTLLMGLEDNWYSKEEVQSFFDNVKIKDKTLKFYQSGHLLPDQFITDVVNSVIEN